MAVLARRQSLSGSQLDSLRRYILKKRRSKKGVKETGESEVDRSHGGQVDEPERAGSLHGAESDQVTAESDRDSDRLAATREADESVEDITQQLEVLRTKLESLKKEKHSLFQELKKVLHEEDEKKRQQIVDQQKHDQDASSSAGITPESSYTTLVQQAGMKHRWSIMGGGTTDYPPPSAKMAHIMSPRHDHTPHHQYHPSLHYLPRYPPPPDHTPSYRPAHSYSQQHYTIPTHHIPPPPPPPPPSVTSGQQKQPYLPSAHYPPPPPPPLGTLSPGAATVGSHFPIAHPLHQQQQQLHPSMDPTARPQLTPFPPPPPPPTAGSMYQPHPQEAGLVGGTPPIHMMAAQPTILPVQEFPSSGRYSYVPPPPPRPHYVGHHPLAASPHVPAAAKQQGSHAGPPGPFSPKHEQHPSPSLSPTKHRPTPAAGGKK